MMSLMDTKQFNIPISLLRQYVFCPRIPYFYLVRQLVPSEKLWIKQGNCEHVRQILLSKRRSFEKYRIKEGILRFNVVLNSNDLGLHGICDAVLENTEKAVIFEFKNSEKTSNNLGAKIQLAAYSLVYEQMTGKEINSGYILFGKKAKVSEVTIDERLKATVLNIVSEIHNTIESSLLPLSSSSENKCCQCEFFNFCADRF